MVGVGRVAALRAAQDEFWKVHARRVRIEEAALEADVDYEAVREWVNQTGGLRPSRRLAAVRLLSLTEREAIAAGLAAVRGVRLAARQLGRSPSTISRETARNRQRGPLTTGSPKGSYRVVSAQGKAKARARRPKVRKLARDQHLAAWVDHQLQLRWSPKQIPERMCVVCPDDEGVLAHRVVLHVATIHGFD